MSQFTDLASARQCVADFIKMVKHAKTVFLGSESESPRDIILNIEREVNFLSEYMLSDELKYLEEKINEIIRPDYSLTVYAGSKTVNIESNGTDGLKLKASCKDSLSMELVCRLLERKNVNSKYINAFKGLFASQVKPESEPVTTEVAVAEPVETVAIEDKVNKDFEQFKDAYLRNDLKKVFDEVSKNELFNKPFNLEQTKQEFVDSAMLEILGEQSPPEIAFFTRLAIELKMELYERCQMFTSRKFFKKDSADKPFKQLIVDSEMQPAIAKIILSEDVILKNILPNDDLDFVVYNMFKHDEHRNIMSIHRSVIDFYSSVRTTAFIFSRHNWKLDFYNNSVDITNPPINYDTWASDITDIKKLGKLIINRAKIGSEFVIDGDPIKVRGFKHEGTELEKLAILALNGHPEFEATLKNYAINMLDGSPIDVSYTFNESEDDVNTMCFLTRDRSKLILIVPSKVIVLAIDKDKSLDENKTRYTVSALTQLDQFNLDTVLSWLTYYLLNNKVL